MWETAEASMKKLCFVLSALAGVLILANSSQAACIGSSPTWTSTPDQSSVASCVSSAKSGDTINVSAGSATWSSVVTLPSSKDLTITGAGNSTTGITCTASICFRIPHSRTYVISGFEFTGNSGFILHRVDGAVSGKYHRIHHNKFTKTGGGYGSIDIFGEPITNCNETTPAHPTMLYDNNQFVDVRININGTACSWVDGEAQHRLWTQNPRPNSPTGAWPFILYVEDNTFTSTGGLINFIDANFSGRYVVRFNAIVSGPGVNGAYAEVHGMDGGNRGVQWKEIYGNTESFGVENFFGLAFIRSGSGVVFQNRVGASAQAMRLNNRRTSEAPGGAPQCNGASNWDGNSGPHGYPCRDQIGRMMDDSLWTNAGEAYSQQLMPFYFWNNYKGAGSTQYVPALHSDTDPRLIDHIVQNRDWYTENTNFTGTTGVGTGTIASRPLSCTTGVAYWATDEGEWNSRNAGADGQLYKCTSANTWTLYYKPYPYPHPLQAGLAFTSSSPIPTPFNLRVQ